MRISPSGGRASVPRPSARSVASLDGTDTVDSPGCALQPGARRYGFRRHDSRRIQAHTGVGTEDAHNQALWLVGDRRRHDGDTDVYRWIQRAHESAEYEVGAGHAA